MKVEKVNFCFPSEGYPVASMKRNSSFHLRFYDNIRPWSYGKEKLRKFQTHEKHLFIEYKYQV